MYEIKIIPNDFYISGTILVQTREDVDFQISFFNERNTIITVRELPGDELQRYEFPIQKHDWQKNGF